MNICRSILASYQGDQIYIFDLYGNEKSKDGGVDYKGIDVNVYIYIYVYIFVCICVLIFMYIYFFLYIY
jgi:hypothetical protein